MDRACQARRILDLRPAPSCLSKLGRKSELCLLLLLQWPRGRERMKRKAQRSVDAGIPAKSPQAVQIVPEFILAVLLLELTPGPNMAYLAALTLDRGRVAGLIAAAGVAAGLTVHAVVAALGLGALIAEFPLIYSLLRWAGVAYLLFLAWETWQSGSADQPAFAAQPSSSLFWRGFFSNVLNPKSIVFFVSVVPSFVRHGDGSPGMAIQLARLGLTYVAIATAIHATIVLLAGRSRTWLVTSSRQRTIRRILAVALVFVAAWLVWTTRRT
jgi:threonine/homoserine/homoserine lactone efflux protein